MQVRRKFGANIFIAYLPWCPDVALLPGDQRKDKTYKPPRASPALSEDSIQNFTLEEEGLEFVDNDKDVQMMDAHRERGEDAAVTEGDGQIGGEKTVDGQDDEDEAMPAPSKVCE